MSTACGNSTSPTYFYQGVKRGELHFPAKRGGEGLSGLLDIVFNFIYAIPCSIIMEPISLSEYLNVENKWTRRLLGLESFAVQRTAEKIHQEYGQEKWGSLLQRQLVNPQHAKELELEILIGPDWRTQETALSLKNEIFRITHRLGVRFYFDVIRSKFENYTADNYCELGCGYGYNFSLFNGVTYGGEFTDAGVTIGHRLGLDVNHFDFYDLASYNMIRPG